MPGTRKLGRTTDHRMAMLKGLVTFLFENGKIETTYMRAKEVSALADKMITIAKQGNLKAAEKSGAKEKLWAILPAKRAALAFLKKEEVAYKLFTQIAPLYTDRKGGYTKVLKAGPRRGDGAEMAVIMLVDAESVYKKEEDEKKSKKADKKAE